MKAVVAETGSSISEAGMATFNRYFRVILVNEATLIAQAVASTIDRKQTS